MEKLRPIPTSKIVMWRAIRARVMPVLIFSAVIALLAVQWRKLNGGGVAGVAEGVRVTIAAPVPGIVHSVLVRPYEMVTAGQELASVRPVDPRTKLDLLQSELEIARLRLQPSLVDQNALDFERLRVDRMRLEQELAVAEVELQRAESALRRAELLRADKLISEDTYDIALRDRNMYQVSISEKRRSLAEIEGRLRTLGPIGDPGLAETNQLSGPLLVHLQSRFADAEDGTRPFTLKAPISGMVHMIHRQPGEFTAEGEPLLAIHAARSDRIVAYMRQPYVVEPRAGMKVEVLTRTRKPRRFTTEVSQVGAHVEAITNALAVIKPFAAVDVGLPVVINVPDHVMVRPGELLDVYFMPETESGNPHDASASEQNKLSVNP